MYAKVSIFLLPLLAFLSWCFEFKMIILLPLCFSQFMSMKRESGKLTIGDLPAKMSRLKVVGSDNLTEEQRASVIQDLHPKLDDDVDFEFFLKVGFLHFFYSNPIGESIICLFLWRPFRLNWEMEF